MQRGPKDRQQLALSSPDRMPDPLARGPDAQRLLPRVIESAADLRDFVNEPEKHGAVFDYLNRFLAYDGLELQRQGLAVRLIQAGTRTQVVADLVVKAEHSGL